MIAVWMLLGACWALTVVAAVFVVLGTLRLRKVDAAIRRIEGTSTGTPRQGA